MKVGVFIGNFPPNIGGGFTIEEDIYQALQRHASESRHQFVGIGFGLQPKTHPLEQISLPSFFFSNALKEVTRIIGKGFRLVTGRNPFGFPLDRIKAFLNKNHFDIIWSLNPGICCMDLPFINVVWDLQHRLQPYFPEVSSGGEWEGREQFFKSILQRATGIIAGTEVGKAEIQQFYQIPPERIFVLPHPTPQFSLLEDERSPANTLAKFGLTEKEYLFYPAQFWSHKNHVCLIQALQILQEKFNVKTRLVFVGSDKGNFSYVENFAKKAGLAERVSFLGFVSRQELVDLYRGAFALAYASYFGPENLPPLEAFALGCPVVAAQVAGSQEQLGEWALLADPKKPEAFAAQLHRLFANESLRKELVEAGKRRARRFTASHFVHGVFQILDDFENTRKCWGNS